MRTNVKDYFLNPKQLLVQIVRARTTIAVCGRATGKTEGMIAPFLWQNMQSMPRSFGCLGANTYSNILANIMPKIVVAWERMGIMREDHFTAGKFGKNWDRPYGCSEKADHLVHTCLGSGFSFAAIDQPKLTAGRDFDFMAIDECKHIDYSKIKEIFPTMRGNVEHFGDLSNHLSRLYVTDMPTSEKGKWILNYREQMNHGLIEFIVNLQFRINTLKEKLKQGFVNKIYAEKEINKYEKDLNELRKKAVFFVTASTLDNIHVLGIDVIDGFKQNLSDFDFRTSVLNEFIIEAENAFYRHFLEGKHTHKADNFSFLDSLDPMETNEKDSRWDSDCDANTELHLSCDYNLLTNNAILGQFNGTTFHVLNHIDASQEDTYKGKNDLRKGIDLKACAEKVCRYYRYHKRKYIYFHYDNTAKSGNASQPEYSFAKEWCEILRKNGWTVQENDLGRASIHDSVDESKSRLRFLEKLFLNQLGYKTSINATNCEDLIIALKATPLKKGRNGRDTKDKRSENLGSSVPFRQQTHCTEAFDHLQEGFAKMYNFANVGANSVLGVLSSH